MTETLVGQFPKHIGSTGGLLNSAETEEKYAIVWKSSKEQAFELPTGGAAIMHEGDNLMYFARKEQCLALGTQLRAFKPRIEDFKIYRIFPGGDIEFLHPKDGVFSEFLFYYSLIFVLLVEVLVFVRLVLILKLIHYLLLVP